MLQGNGGRRRCCDKLRQEEIVCPSVEETSQLTIKNLQPGLKANRIMNEIECPYCEHEYDLCHDDGAFYNTNEEPEVEVCPNCEKMFLVTPSISWDFSAEKADCLNDGNHQWKKEHSKYVLELHPQMARKEICATCHEKRTVEITPLAPEETVE